jgi:SNF2 family DNA or RNA helicase
MNLIEISRLCRANHIEIEFNQLGLKLVNDFIKDRNNIRGISENKEFADILSLLKNANFNRVLKDEQVRDAKTLLSLRHGANFSVPGAGKTTTLLAVHSILLLQAAISKLVVICPINAFISWEDEIKDIFLGGKKVLRLTQSVLSNFGQVIDANPDVLLVNYEKLRKKNSPLLAYFLNNTVHLILDESHRVKSGTNNLSFGQIAQLAVLSKRRDILSGTPMPQSYLDLQPQFELLWPGEQIVPNLEKLSDDEKIPLVNSSIKGLYVRTTKDELQLKSPEITYTPLQLGPLQSELYHLIKSETARIISGMPKKDVVNFRNIGKSVIRLIQAATNPMLLTLNDDLYEETSPLPEGSGVWELLEEFVKYERPRKIEYLENRVEEILRDNENNKIVIWSYFVRNIQLLERLFKNFNPVSIYGGISTGTDKEDFTREGRIRRFHQDSSCRLMIANPQACGEGISLHKVCHYAIYLDRNFNAAHFLQSIDRIHRLGLPKDISTNIEILVSENTVDELLFTRLNEKISNMGKTLNDKYLQALAYDPADISLNDESGLDNKDFAELIKHLGL